MNVLVANSSKQKIDQLSNLLNKINNKINIVGIASIMDDVEKIIKKNSNILDLIICETHLQNESAINNSSIKSTSVPVIFSSNSKENAYDAIKSNCLDFLIEPFDFDEVSLAIKKAKAMRNTIGDFAKRYKNRFIIKIGEKIQFRTVDQISYIYAEGKMAYIITKNPSRKYIIEYTLDELEKHHLDPANFYRINRKFIINIDSIEEARQYVNSRLKLVLNPPTDVDMVVSREKVPDFKNWLNQ